MQDPSVISTYYKSPHKDSVIKFYHLLNRKKTNKSGLKPDYKQWASVDQRYKVLHVQNSEGSSTQVNHFDLTSDSDKILSYREVLNLKNNKIAETKPPLDLTNPLTDQIRTDEQNKAKNPSSLLPKIENTQANFSKSVSMQQFYPSAPPYEDPTKNNRFEIKNSSTILPDINQNQSDYFNSVQAARFYGSSQNFQKNYFQPQSHSNNNLNKQSHSLLNFNSVNTHVPTITNTGQINGLYRNGSVINHHVESPKCSCACHSSTNRVNINSMNTFQGKEPLRDINVPEQFSYQTNIATTATKQYMPNNSTPMPFNYQQSMVTSTSNIYKPGYSTPVPNLNHSYKHTVSSLPAQPPQIQSQHIYRTTSNDEINCPICQMNMNTHYY